MQKPRFRTVEKSAWVFATTRLHPQKPRKMDRRTATRCGYLATAAALLNRPERDLPTPYLDEPMSRYVARLRAGATSGANG
jgi:hypothetical protein